MKFTANLPGLTLYTDGQDPVPWEVAVGSAEIVAMAQAAEDLGMDYIPIATHFLMDNHVAETMGPRWVHSLSIAGFILGATKRIKVMCLVVVPNHNPIELAKALATIDWASGGRLIVIPMVGYQQWEFKVLNVPFEERGPIMDEHMDVMLELWNAEKPSFNGKYTQFDDVVFDPKPVQDPLPLWFGGRTKAALRRIARLGHGWMTTTTEHKDLPAWLDYIREQPEFQANPRPLEMYAPMADRKMINFDTHEMAPPEVYRTPEAIVEQVRYLETIGTTVTSAALEGGGKGDRPTGVDDFISRMEWFSREVLPEAQATPSTA